ncbi:hypothetical protein ACHAQA_003927 [Verticillium albo-atrum]
MATDHEKAERNEIQEELHIEVLPGTEIMTDVNKHQFIKSEHSSLVLVPQPSQDPHDPLNWKASWKYSVLAAVSLMTFTQGFAPLALAPMFPYLIQDYESNLEDVIQFTGVTILILGFSNFICLNGIGAGPSETLQPQVTADVFFLHDRGSWNTLYWVTYMGSLMNFWWLNVAMTGASIVYAVFGFPETRWDRSVPVIDTVSTTGVAEDAGKAPAQSTEAEQTPNVDSHLGKGTPSKQQWHLFQRNSSPMRAILFDLWTPWKLFAFPIVLFASFVVSWSCSNFLILNLTQSQVFAAPPYNMSSQSIGFLNLAVLVGALLGLVTAGPFSDWVSARATSRNAGIREPEMRLPAMIPFIVIMVFGNIITAIGYQYHWPWPAIVILGYTSAGIQVAALPSIASTYAIDCYKPVTGPLMVAITVNKNVWGYGMGRFITPWTIQDGFIPAFMTNMALTVFWCGLGVIFYYHGKTFRRWTRNSSVHNQ